MAQIINAAGQPTTMEQLQAAAQQVAQLQAQYGESLGYTPEGGQKAEWQAAAEQKLSQAMAQAEGAQYVGDDGKTYPIQMENGKYAIKVNEDSGDRGRPEFQALNADGSLSPEKFKGAEPGTWWDQNRGSVYAIAAIASLGAAAYAGAGAAAAGGGGASSAGAAGASGAAAGEAAAGTAGAAGSGVSSGLLSSMPELAFDSMVATPQLAGAGGLIAPTAAQVGAGASVAGAANGWTSAEGGDGYLNGQAADQPALNTGNPNTLSGDQSLYQRAADAAKQYGGTTAQWLSKLSGVSGNALGGLLGAGLGALAGTQDQTSQQNTSGSTTSNTNSTTNQVANTSGTSQTQSSGTTSVNPNDPASIQAAGGVYGNIANGGGAYASAANPYANAKNPYLDQTIDAANRGLLRNYNQMVAPKYSSGSSFGSSGLGFLEVNDRANLSSQLSDNANTLSYQGYNQAANLAESGAQRQDAASQFGTNARLQGANGLLNAGQAMGQTTQQNLLSNSTNNSTTNTTANTVGNTTGTSNGQSTTTAPGNVWAGALGGGLLGSKITSWL